jgi:hypothetical protein
MNFVWSTGEKYEKSNKNDKTKYLLSDEKCESDKIQKNPPKTLFDLEQIETQQVVGLKSNRREESNVKITERYLISQTHQNPFLADNDYIRDLDIQSKYLIPRTEANTPNYAEI